MNLKAFCLFLFLVPYEHMRAAVFLERIGLLVGSLMIIAAILVFLVIYMIQVRCIIDRSCQGSKGGFYTT